MEVGRDRMLAFDLIETVLSLGMLVALVVLALRRRFGLVIVGVVATVASFPAFRWLLNAHGSGSWQIWVFRVAGVLIAGLFIWLALRERLGARAGVAPASLQEGGAHPPDGLERRRG
jgi:hypothetical protein